MNNLDLFEIHQAWTDLREARVKDGFIFRVSRYFLDHWLRLLGSKAAWAVVDLQQRCYLQKSDYCQASLKDLCAATGVRSTTTMQAIVDQPLLRWFFTKQNTRKRRSGKIVRGKNRYNLQMSDPLTPEHQGQVAWLLAERLRDGTVPAVCGTSDLIRLVSDLPPLSTLPTEGLPAWATREPLNLRQIAFRVLSQAGIDSVPANLADEAALRRAFADAQASISRPARIVLATHYFRTEWVPQLGAVNAWLVIALRSRCYWNKESGEIRDVCVMSNQGLADLLGISSRTATRALQDSLLRKFVSPRDRVFEPRISDGRKIPAGTRFQVHLTLDPLTPPDEEIFGQILLSDAVRFGLDPTTGQMNMLNILDMMSQMTSDEITRQRRQWDDKNGKRRLSNNGLTDKIEKRRSRLDSPNSASDDKNELRAHAEKPQTGWETSPSGGSEARSLESGMVLPPSSPQKSHFKDELSDKTEIRRESNAKSGFRSSESSDKIDTISPEPGDKTGEQYLNTYINTKEDEREQQQQYPAAAAHLPPDLHQILVQYGIEEPALSEILANSVVTPELARAWMLYADNEPGLKHRAGYVVQRLNKVPPDVPVDPDLQLIAGLSDDDATGFAQRRLLELSMGAEVSFGDERREAQYQAWIRFYGHERGAIREGNISIETALARDTGGTPRWQPDVG